MILRRMKHYQINLITSLILILTAIGIYFIGRNELLAIIIACCAFVEFGLAFLPKKRN